jgi:hypothetical protein
LLQAIAILVSTAVYGVHMYPILPFHIDYVYC